MKTNTEFSELLQVRAEDAAYTFKGLYKTADWLHINYRLLLVWPTILGLVTFGFANSMPASASKLMSFIALACTFALLVNQRRYEQIFEYRQLGEKYKALYEKAHSLYYSDSNNESSVQSVVGEMDSLADQIARMPISTVGRWWARATIKQEMDLHWLSCPDSRPSAVKHNPLQP